MSAREPDGAGARSGSRFFSGGVRGRGVAIIDAMTRARTLGVPEGLRPRRLDIVLVVTTAVMATITIILVADPSFVVARWDRTLDAAITSISALAASALALLTLPRFQESGRLSLLLLGAAF